MKKWLSLLLVLILTLGMFGCAQEAAPSGAGEPGAAGEVSGDASSGSGIQDGTYTVESQGMEAGMILEVTFSGGKITDIQVVEHNETAGICETAFERVPAAIIAAGSVSIDTVSGATMTSNGIINGVLSAIEMAGGDAADFQGEAAGAGEQEEVERQVDLVVAGGGLAGLTAAITAAENGATVLLVEKNAQTGGSLTTAGGNFISVDSEIAAGYEVDDNKEAAMALWRKTAEAGPNPPGKYPEYDRVEFLMDQINDNFKWMLSHGVPYYRASEADDDTMVKIYTEGGGAAVTAALDAAARSAGVEILTDTAATELLVEDGKVMGLKAESASQVLTVKADNVILATGGFGMNPDMIAELVPEYAGAVARGGAGNTGDGFKMAEAVGAAFYENPWVIPSSISLNPAIDVENTDRLTFRDKAMVDATGKRIINEDNGIGSIVTNAVAYCDTAAYAIFDSSDADVAEVLEDALSTGAVFKGETLEELATAAGIDGEALGATVEAYNSYAASGVDSEFGKKAENMVAYADGPYYAVNYVPVQLGTVAGVVTDTDGRVLDSDGNAIAGLFAAGEMSNRQYYNQAYVGAASLSLYSIAARNAADAATK